MTTPTPSQPDATRSTGQDAQLSPRYHLVLLDDDEHSYEYVIELLGQVFGYEHEKSYAIACAVDSMGRAIVETADHERVLLHQQQIHAFGRDPRVPRCKGSMSSVIEAVP